MEALVTRVYVECFPKHQIETLLTFVVSGLERERRI